LYNSAGEFGKGIWSIQWESSLDEFGQVGRRLTWQFDMSIHHTDIQSTSEFGFHARLFIIGRCSANSNRKYGKFSWFKSDDLHWLH